MSSPLVDALAQCWSAWPRRVIAGGIVVGVSGGADSVALVSALSGLARKRGVALTVAHAHHGLRGADADADAVLVQQLAVRLGWAWVTARLNIRGEMNRTAESVEMTARRLRHAFLARTAREVGAAAIALAHHADDQVELFLLRLFRGAGGDGLGGMPALGPSPADPGITLLRPLLGVAKSELIQYVNDVGAEFREDHSNHDLAIPRNHLRQVVLPWLRDAVGPHLDQVIRRTAEIVGADAASVDALADTWLAARRPKAFSRLTTAVQRAVVRRQLWDLGCPVEFDLVERLRLTQTRQSAAAGRSLQRQATGRIQPARAPAPADFQPEQQCILMGAQGTHTFAGVRLKWRVKPVKALPARAETGAPLELFDAAAVGSQITLRHWQPGDRFQPLGFSRPTKLQNLFTNRKVPAAERRQRVLATTADGIIFWVEGLPPGERFKTRTETRSQLQWSWVRPAVIPAATEKKRASGEPSK